MNSAIVITKVDPQTKKQAMKTASDLGMPLSVVIKAFLKQFIRTKSISLSIDNEVPNEYMLNLLKKSEEEYKKGQVISFKSSKEEIAYIDKVIENAKSPSHSH